VWNRVTNKWDHFDTPSCAPFYAWGWGAGVSKFSKNKDMAFDWFCFESNFANTDHDIVIGRFGVNPFRKQHMEASYWHDRAGWDLELSQSYSDVLKSMDTSTNRVFDLRVPGVNQYYTALTASAAKALAGQMTAKDALDEAAEEWKRITERIGVDKIREAYKNVVAQEDNEPVK
jgi:multiple sugar transport system substrate-binding protein